MTLGSILSLISLTAAQPAAAVAAAPVPAAAPKVSWSGELKLPALSAIDEALAQPLAEEMTVILADHTQRSLKTCKDYLAVADAKFDLPPDHRSDVDWDGLVSVIIRCVALDALKAAKPATTSNLGWFKFSQTNVAKLPPTLGMALGENDGKAMEKAAKNCTSWGKYDRHLKLHIDGPDNGQIQADGWAGRLTLFARADLNGDGVEDLMFYRYASLKDGENNDESIFIVTQTSAKGCPQIIRALPEALGRGKPGH